uniref:arabinan endo-1,5-alpha-L-arabinosidase n=1 Tax=Globisporangium ultimum (strain ATCC 200006 / CBS 805.95 / DAOM BR144) TaxID=431595 RepID=K3WGW3_GLOUD
MVKLVSLLLGLPLLASLVDAYANPKLCTGVCVNAHDSSIVRRTDGTYFRFSTGGGIAVHSAPALTGPWTYKGNAMTGGSKINRTGKDDMWAPDVTNIGGTYYMYYSISKFGTQESAIGYATSKTMEVGSWTDHSTALISSDKTKPYNAIDANYINVNGAHYLTFGSFWKDIYQVKLSSPNRPSGSAYQIAYDSVNTAMEGATIFKYGSYYYLFFSKGSCCNYDKKRPAAGAEYKIMACRSKSATGGFVDKNGVSCTKSGGTTVLASHGYVYGPGGQGVMQDPKYGPVLYYHYVDTRVGYADGQKKLGWNQINFSTGWPVV